MSDRRFAIIFLLCGVAAYPSGVSYAQSAARVSSPGLIPPVRTQEAAPETKKPRTSQPAKAIEASNEADEAQAEEVADNDVSLEAGGLLNLMCLGSGAANKASVASAYGWNSYGYSSTGTIIGSRSQDFRDQVSLFIQGDGGRARCSLPSVAVRMAGSSCMTSRSNPTRSPPRWASMPSTTQSYASTDIAA